MQYSEKDEDRSIFERMIPPLLEGFNNPCWVECVHQNELDAFYSAKHYASRKVIRNPLTVLNDTLIKNHPKWRLRCLPKFYVIGMPKCGTTDLFAK